MDRNGYFTDDKVVNGDKEEANTTGGSTGGGGGGGGGGSGEHVSGEEADVEVDDEVYYDKAKSFFDNISCEASERAKGYVQYIVYMYKSMLKYLTN